MPVVLVLCLDLLHQRLKGAHRLDLTALFDRQRDHYHSDDQRECNHGDAEVAEKQAVQQYQAVDHRLDDCQVPSVDYEIQCVLAVLNMPCYDPVGSDRLDL